MKIKSVIFDIGGVILEDPEVKDFWKDIDESKLLRKEFGSNKISIEDFIKKGSEILNMNEKEFLTSYKKAYLNIKPIKEVYELYINMKCEKYIISDTNPIHMEFLKENYKDMLNSSKKVYFSVETNMRKDSVDIFKYVLNDINLKPEEVLFIDNKEKIINLAKSIGINTIHYTSFDKFKKELKNYSIISE